MANPFELPIKKSKKKPIVIAIVIALVVAAASITAWTVNTNNSKRLFEAQTAWEVAAASYDNAKQEGDKAFESVTTVTESVAKIDKAKDAVQTLTEAATALETTLNTQAPTPDLKSSGQLESATEEINTLTGTITKQTVTVDDNKTAVNTIRLHHNTGIAVEKYNAVADPARELVKEATAFLEATPKEQLKSESRHNELHVAMMTVKTALDQSDEDLPALIDGNKDKQIHDRAYELAPYSEELEANIAYAKESHEEWKQAEAQKSVGTTAAAKKPAASNSVTNTANKKPATTNNSGSGSSAKKPAAKPAAPAKKPAAKPAPKPAAPKPAAPKPKPKPPASSGGGGWVKEEEQGSTCLVGGTDGKPAVVVPCW